MVTGNHKLVAERGSKRKIMPKIPKKKKKERSDVEESAGADTACVEIADKIQELKITKAKSKSLFTRRKNQLLDSLDDAFLTGYREIRNFRKLLDEALERVIEDLTSLAELYSKAKDRSGLDKTSREIEDIEGEFAKAQERFQEYLDVNKREFANARDRVQEYLEATKDDLSSQASGLSGKLLDLQSQEAKARQHVTDLEEKFHEKEGSIGRARKQHEDEYVRRRKEIETEFKEVEAELSQAKQDAKDKFRKLESAMDEGLGITRPPPPGNDLKTEKKNDNSPDLELGKDMWKQLTRVSIPVFSGDKRSYGSWKAAFMACVDKAPATPEYKLLQLKKYLSGEALKAVESLGHSAEAYEAAKSRLERKYGGQRRQINLYMEELDQFRPIRAGFAKDLDKLADLLGVIVINLKEAGRQEELGHGTMYLKIQKKMTESMLANYNRWVFERKKPECVETLREWIIQEAEFQTVAAETLCGVAGKRRERGRTFFGQTKPPGKAKMDCEYCKKDHPLWRCEEFKKMDVRSRWHTTKQLRVCFCCLRRNHTSDQCTRSKTCGIDGCQRRHNSLLHGGLTTRDDGAGDGANQEPGTVRPEGRRELAADMGRSGNVLPGSSSVMEGERMVSSERSLTTTMTASKFPEQTHFVGLCTVPVVVKNGGRQLVLNALLDDASTKSYINEDVAAELGLEGTVQNITVNVLNGNEGSFQTMPVEFDLQSVDGRTSTRVSAFTTTRVTGNMRPVNWKVQATKRKHLKGINFPNLGLRPIVDMLIGIDYAELHYSIKDIRGQPGEPVARLTPLGWTCIGAADVVDGSLSCTNLNMAYFVHPQGKELTSVLQKFWEIETAGSELKKESLRREEESAIKEFESSVQFKDGRYEVEMPWKPNISELPNNYDMAVNRLLSTEKRLLKDPQLDGAYSNIINEYLKKGYICKVTPSDKVEKAWYLPHFAIVKPEKTTTKTRVVFDASAKCNGVSLNDAIYQGPKLERDLFDVLLRFRRFPVALICDIAQMYLRIGMAPSSRPLHRFLWRDLDQSRPPDEYQFNSLVFGVNSCPYQAQFVSQKHTTENKKQYPKAAETILESTYMGDSMDSVPSDEECLELYDQLSKRW